MIDRPAAYNLGLRKPSFRSSDLLGYAHALAMSDCLLDSFCFRPTRRPELRWDFSWPRASRRGRSGGSKEAIHRGIRWRTKKLTPAGTDKVSGHFGSPPE